MNLLQNPPTGIKLLVLYVSLMSLLKLAEIVDISWKWILIPLAVLIGILFIAFIFGLIKGFNGYQNRVNFWESFYSRKPNGDREDFNKWL